MQPLKTTLPIAFLAAIAVIPNATAQDYYVEGTVGVSSYDFNSDFQEEYTTLGARFGRNFSSNLAIEGELGFGTSDKNGSVSGIDALTNESFTINMSESLNSSYGFFGKTMLPINDRLTAHARLGYATSEFEYKSDIIREDGTTDEYGFKDVNRGLAYGLGTEYNFTDKLYARADATRYEADSRDVESYTLGVGFRF